MDTRSLEVPAPSDQDPVPLASLDLDEEYANAGVRAIIQFHGTTDTTTISPESSVSYRNTTENAEAKPKQTEHCTPDSTQPLESKSGSAIALVSQALLDVKFLLDLHLKDEVARDQSILCEVYYDPRGDDLVLRNMSGVNIEISSKAGHPIHKISRMQTIVLTPGTHSLYFHGSRILDLKTLPKVDISNERLLRLPTSSRGNKSLKRALLDTEEDLQVLPNQPLRQSRRLNHIEGNSSILFFPTGRNSPLTRNPLLDLAQGGILEIPGIFNEKTYEIHKRLIIARRAQCEVYQIGHSSIDEAELVVKVLKVRKNNEATEGLSLISQATAWLQEYNVHNGLKHDSIVELYGGDARFMALYQEYIPASDLSARGTWLNPDNNLFQGTEDNAFQVLTDMSCALEYLHSRGIEHNDIKPGNILFSTERGAMLCDFGLSCQTDPSRVTNGGSSCYIPPEFIQSMKRGKPGDIWALGIVMLYLKGLMPLPEEAASRETCNFKIADIHYKQQPDKLLKARTKMNHWLTRVASIRSQIVCSQSHDFIIRDMLEFNPSMRPTATELVKRSKEEKFRRTHIPQSKGVPQTRTTAEGGGESHRSPRSTDHGSTTEENESIEWVPKNT